MDSAASSRPESFRSNIGDEFGDGLAEDLRARVKAELEPGERLLWAGQSAPPPVRMNPPFLVALGVGLAFLAAGVIIISVASRDSRVPGGNGPIAFRTQSDTQPAIGVGIGLIVMGGITLAFAIGGHVAQRFARTRQRDTCYAVTDRRAIAWIPDAKSEGTRVLSLPRGHIRTVVRVERPDGSGSLELTLVHYSPYHEFQQEGFKSIPDVRRVEHVVRNHLTAPDTIPTNPDASPGGLDVVGLRHTVS
jgi:hypothetical protein